jgi:hypothetical protein
MFKERDIIDIVLERAVQKPGLIDWSWIDAEFVKLHLTVERKVLHKRLKQILEKRAKEPWSR